MKSDLTASYFWAFAITVFFTLVCGWAGSEGRGFRPVQNVREGWFGATSVEMAQRVDPWVRELYGELNVSNEEIDSRRQRTKLICDRTGQKVKDVHAESIKKGFVPGTLRDLVVMAQTPETTFVSNRVVVVLGDTPRAPGTVSWYAPSFADKINYAVTPQSHVRSLDLIAGSFFDGVMTEGMCLLVLQKAGLP